jgi:hypothetical protein
MLVFANVGSAALYLLFVWLLSAAGAAWMADRKGYTERVGLLFGLVLSVVGFIIVLLGLEGRGGHPQPRRAPPAGHPRPGARRRRPRHARGDRPPAARRGSRAA